MISRRLNVITRISLVVIILRGLEEYFTGFYNNDPLFNYLIQPLLKLEPTQAFLVEFHILSWIFLAIILIILQGRKGMLLMMTLYGTVFFLEAYYFSLALKSWQYYPGSVTALILTIIGIFYWKELFREFHRFKKYPESK